MVTNPIHPNMPICQADGQMSAQSLPWPPINGGGRSSVNLNGVENVVVDSAGLVECRKLSGAKRLGPGAAGTVQ